MKETIQLPATDFPMKGNLPEREPVMIAEWDKKQTYAKILEKNAGRPPFTMPDGPPYANGNIHIGHVLNKCLKDFTVKFKNMSGFNATFIPGWDCHGLPIEINVTKELGAKRKEKSDSDIRALCRQEAGKWVKIQGEQFKRLGVLADWQEPYLTMDPAYEA
ncbi:MAG: class I tRNA ligase family protein, partial [Bdellovibrionales bacterium]|nr:class I tRNA ligase family protein [Bdellovibrionales bacterium]